MYRKRLGGGGGNVMEAVAFIMDGPSIADPLGYSVD